MTAAGHSEKTGRCLCGAIVYEILGPVQMTALCHCRNCQRQSGTAYSIITGVLKSDYRQTGETRIFQDTGDSGRRVERHFCGACGSPILSIIEPLPDMLFIKAGTLDDISELQPAIEVYCDSAMPYVPPVPGTQKFPKSNI